MIPIRSVTRAARPGPTRRKVDMDSLLTESPSRKKRPAPWLGALLSLLLLLPAGARALAGPDDLEDLRARARAANIGEEPLAAWTERIQRLEHEGLPWEPVVDRIRQGLAKGADAARIETACGRLEERLRQGGRLVDGIFDGSARLPGSEAAGSRLVLIDQTAFALEKGVTEEAFGQLFRQVPLPGTPLERMNGARAPLLAYTSLTSEGVAPDRGLRFVSEVHQGGVRGAALEEIGLAAAQSLRAGVNLDTIQGQIMDGLRRGIPAAQIARGLRGHPGGPQLPAGTLRGQPHRPGVGSGGMNPPRNDPGRRGQPGGGGGRHGG